MLTLEKGKEIIERMREQVYKIPAAYEYITSYVGTGKTLREDLLNILKYLANTHEKTNEAGNIEQRFFIGYHQYCFFLDTDAIISKIYKFGRGKERANHGINLLCALGFFTKDKESYKYMVNMGMKLNQPDHRYMNIYHFKDIELDKIEQRAKRLRQGKITVSSISRASLIAAGLKDIANEIYFQNDIDIMPKKISGYRQVFFVLQELVNEKGYCTKNEILQRSSMKNRQVTDLLRMFKKDILQEYNYRPATKENKEKYNYSGTKWIYTKKEVKK